MLLRRLQSQPIRILVPRRDPLQLSSSRSDRLKQPFFSPLKRRLRRHRCELVRSWRRMAPLARRKIGVVRVLEGGLVHQVLLKFVKALGE